jgi:hypothetical protein
MFKTIITIKTKVNDVANCQGLSFLFFYLQNVLAHAHRTLLRDTAKEGTAMLGARHTLTKVTFRFSFTVPLASITLITLKIDFLCPDPINIRAVL